MSRVQLALPLPPHHVVHRATPGPCACRWRLTPHAHAQATNHLGAHSFFTTSDEAQWAAVRKACAPAFSSGNVR